MVKERLFNGLKLLSIGLMVIVINFNGAATDLKTEGEKPVKSKTENNSSDLEKEKIDSLKTIKSKETSVKSGIKGTTYDRELYLKQDSVSETSSVITFNFIQYIIQNFKYSEEMY
jgi:hypothetical protein